MRARRSLSASGLAVVVLFTVALDGPRRPGGERSAPAPPPAFATVTLHGASGTFGSSGETTPSGQKLARAPVPGWDFAPGVQAYRNALADDGTVLVAGISHNADLRAPTAERATVAAYHPKSNRFTTVQIGPVRAGAPSVTDLLPVPGGVAFATHRAAGAPAGPWPAFGVLTTVDGTWRVAPVGGRVPGYDLHDLATMPRSRHIIAVRYGEGDTNGALLALRLRGPDAAGRFTVEVTGEYRYPEAGSARVRVREVQVDPTSAAGDERFAVGLDVDRGRGKFPHQVVQEFGYDADTGRFRPISAPLVAGDRNRERTAFFAFGPFLYDHAGNLWVSRVNGFHGGKLAIYTARDGRRRLASGACRYRPDRPLDRYRTAASGDSTAPAVWGQSCRPDYDILQTQHLLAVEGLVQDPDTKNIVALGFNGVLVPIRATPSGGGLAFRIGNVVDLGRKLLPTATGNVGDHRIGGVDAAHRVWVSAMHSRPGQAGVRLDQWLYSVDIDDLLDPAPVALPATPGRTVTVQAERSGTTTTTARPGAWATVDVDSDAYVHGCVDWPTSTTCGYDGVAGNGYSLADDSNYGHLRGFVDYPVEVPVAGRYRISYRVATFRVLTEARIALSVGGQQYVDPVSTGGSWRTVRRAEPITLPAGRHTLRLSVPKGGGGWYLNWFALQRVSGAGP